tara:strand:+ start:1108 stop:1515 length:408 start_codon:yes stop_codon:yes gene_type:complete
MFFKKDSDKNKALIKIGALLVHAAKIDQNYSGQEKEIIKTTLLKIGNGEENVDNLIKKAEEIENNSNQILEFTKEVKNMSHENKIEIIETLWKIIYSNKEADIYETSLMRRLGGLLYIDSSTMGDIKEKIKKEYS